MTNTEQFRHVDTKKAPGVYVSFKCKIVDDAFACDLLADLGHGDETEEHRAETAARIRAFERGDWYYVGIRAIAKIQHVHSNGSSTLYEIESAGLWGIESDSGEDYIKDVFEDECQDLRNLIKAMGAAVFEERANP